MRRCWGFYSSEVLPLFLVAQVFSLQNKSFPCSLSLFLIGQVFSLWNSSFRNPKRGGQVIHCEESAVFKVFPQYFPMLCPIHTEPSFHQGFHTKNGLDFLLAPGHGPVGLVRPYLLFLSSSIGN